MQNEIPFSFFPNLGIKLFMAGRKFLKIGILFNIGNFLKILG